MDPALARLGEAAARDRADRPAFRRHANMTSCATRTCARSPTEMAAVGTGAPIETIRGLFSAGDGYATPRIDVRAAVIENGRILLVKERADGAWCMPGGWADVGEGPSVAAVREAREESGYEVRAVKLVALLDRNRSPPSAADLPCLEGILPVPADRRLPAGQHRDRRRGLLPARGVAAPVARPHDGRADRTDVRAPPKSGPADLVRLDFRKAPVRRTLQ